MKTVLLHMLRFGAVTGFVLSVAAWTAVCLSFAVPCQAREPYRIGFTPGVLVSVEAKDRLTLAYERAGLPVEFVPLPQKRSLYLAAEGSLDGEVGRIAGLEKRYPSMVRVNVQLMVFRGAAYVAAGRDIDAYSDELLDTLRVGSLCGVVWAEKVMKGRCLEHVKNYDSLFGMLQEGRIDMALCSMTSAEAAIADNPGVSGRIRRLEPQVYQAAFYHYLHMKNADIVPQLEKALRELRAENGWDDESGD